MFQAIHVDRFNLCHENAILQLDQNGHSPHGNACCRPFLLPYGQPGAEYANIGDFNSVLIEHFFELVRQAKFPDKPSRFECWYGADPSDPDPMYWSNREGFRNYPVWQISADKVFKADSRLLDIFSVGPDGLRYFHPEMMIQNAEYYWEGKTLADLLYDRKEPVADPSALAPIYEVLLVPPIRVSHRIR